VTAAGNPRLAAEWRRISEFLDLSVLSYFKFFDHRLDDLDKKNFYMEREWRATKNIEFSLDNVQRLIIPAAYSQRLRRAFPSYDGEVIFAD
jgi:hypothetical protein